MTPDLQQALASYAHDNEIVMLICDPFHADGPETASFYWGGAADELLNSEAVRAVTTRQLERLFVFIGKPFGKLRLTKAGPPDEVIAWASDMAKLWGKKKLSPAILAFVKSEPLRATVAEIIADSENNERWSKFRL